MFDELIEIARNKLMESNDFLDPPAVIDLAAKVLISDTQSHEDETIAKVIAENEAFIKRNRNRWGRGFQKLHALRETVIQAGMNFQNQFLEYEEYQHDVLLGVFMRQHAHACRISGEIIHLLEGGYPDAAIARWRTLYEIVVTCLVINKYGRDAAIDYVKHGIVKNTEGMLEYQKRAEEMGLPPFTEKELQDANRYREEITGGNHAWHWAREHAGVSKFEKLRELVGMEKWSHNYKLASRNIHSDYYEMASLHAMSETKSDLLLVGQSNSGMTNPAHFTAISLAQITYIFIMSYFEEDKCQLDYTDNQLFMRVIDNYVDEVGNVFVEIEQAIQQSDSDDAP